MRTPADINLFAAGSTDKNFGATNFSVYELEIETKRKYFWTGVMMS